VATSGSKVTITLKGTTVDVTVEPPHVHSYTETITTQPGCESTGSKKVTCTTCQKTSTEEIAALGHDFKDGKCENCGEEDPDYETPDTGSSIYLAMIAAMTSLMGIVVLTNKKRF
jgi:hypothetical protein